MKFLKSLILITSIFIVACSQDSMEESQTSSELTEEIPEEKTSADHTSSSGIIAPFRITLEQLSRQQKSFTAEDPDNSLCFQFVYPITVSYNDDSSAIITAYDQLLQVILDETPALHLTDITYPFQVIYTDDSTETIANTEDFEALISRCDYDQIDYNYIVSEVGSCFSIGYPVNLVVNENVLSFDNQQEVQDYFTANPASSSEVDLSYPLQVTLLEDNSQVSITGDYEMIHLITETCGIE